MVSRDIDAYQHNRSRDDSMVTSTVSILPRASSDNFRENLADQLNSHAPLPQPSIVHELLPVPLQQSSSPAVGRDQLLSEPAFPVSSVSREVVPPSKESSRDISSGPSPYTKSSIAVRSPMRTVRTTSEYEQPQSQRAHTRSTTTLPLELPHAPSPPHKPHPKPASSGATPSRMATKSPHRSNCPSPDIVGHAKTGGIPANIGLLRAYMGNLSKRGADAQVASRNNQSAGKLLLFFELYQN